MGQATQVLEACAKAGVREFCVCAGARNVALVVALERSTGCRVWHFFDERSAAFFALGRIMKSGEPVAVVTTSGTAVAELLPATVEAYYQSLPLVLITADRPERFRGSGAPQAIEQEGVFGVYARSWDRDCLAEAIAEEVPVHLNVCLEEPGKEEVAAVAGLSFEGGGKRMKGRRMGDQRVAEFVAERGGLLVMLGNLRADERIGLAEFLRRLGAPVLAEAGSGLREKLPGLIVREVPQAVVRVLRIGGVPSARFWRDLEDRPQVEVVSVAAFPGLARESTTFPRADWAQLEIEAREASFELGEFNPEGEARWLRFLSETISGRALVYLGNSLPIREWNQAATFEDRGLRCYSSRGANGIDGQLSTFFGLSDGEVESWAIVGDLTAMYDLSAPWSLRELGGGKRRIVVINNGGGRIFSKLPALAGLADNERRAIENDHRVSLQHWAAMWGMAYVRVEREEDFVVDGEAVVIEIMVEGGAP